jgi:hypothetical protein
MASFHLRQVPIRMMGDISGRKKLERFDIPRKESVHVDLRVSDSAGVTSPG